MEVEFGSWSVLTTNFLVLMYIALGGVTLASVLHLCNGQWRFQVRYLSCSFYVLYPIAGIVLLILLANGDATFQWLGHGHGHDEEHHLNGWHNYSFLVLRQIFAYVVVGVLFSMFIKYQHLTDIDKSEAVRWRFRNIALLVPFAYFLYGTLLAWDFEMTMVPGWHSASYGAYQFQSGFHMFLAFFTLFLFFTNRSGKLTKPFESYIFNFMAQFMLAMTILWTYLYFTQYLIMWYGRLPTDMARYDSMMLEGFGLLWWTFLALKFIIPFTTLAITPNRHNPVIITMVAGSILLGSWIERYTWIAGSGDSEHYIMPLSTLFGITVTIVLIAVSWIAVKKTLIKYGLLQTES
ncbi:MAG: hypothetical protein ACE5EH_00925 [Gammaproteobacteria bacterium]